MVTKTKNKMLYVKNRGFSLIELLIAISIIMVVAGILVPVLVRARSAAYVTSGMMQMKQIGLANMIYTEDHGLPALDLAVLERSGLIPSSLAQSAIDPEPNGLSNSIVAAIRPDPQHLDLQMQMKISFVSWGGTFSYKTTAYNDLLQNYENTGWLVDLIPVESTDPHEVWWKTPYRRLTHDGAVIRRPAAGSFTLTTGETAYSPFFVFFDCDDLCRTEYFSE